MIEVSNLIKKFKSSDTIAVNQVSFKIEKAEIVCIIGTSGCGKTTTLKMINRLVEPTAGEISIGGNSFKDQDPVEWRRNIGYVVQKAGLLPHLTVSQNIALLSSVTKKPANWIKNRVSELMDLIQMPEAEFGGKYPLELSGGQQQRVGIARALMENPEVLLMDEPFGALDPITRKELHSVFLNLNKKLLKTILIVTHDIEEAFYLGNRVMVMDQGRLVQMGSPGELRVNPQNDFVRRLIKN